VDALKILRYKASLSYSQNEECPDIETGILTNGQKQGNVDCSNNSVNSVDALKILRYKADLSYNQTEPCPDIGS
jgi:hypothetical protein